MFDQTLAEQFRDQVLAAMQQKAWSAARLSKESGVSQTTITKVTNASGEILPGTVGKLREALGIMAPAQAQAESGYPLIIEVIRDAIGLWLLEIPPEQLPAKVAHLFAAIASSGTDPRD